MKKRNTILLAGLLVLGLLASCKKENKDNTGEGLVLRASIENRAGNVRTELDPTSGEVTWVDGDQIAVNTPSNVCTLRTGAGTTQGEFKGTASTEAPYMVAYPADKVSDINVNGKSVTFEMPSVQVLGTAANTFANGSSPMVAYSEDEDLYFYNVFGGLGVSLKGNTPMTKIELEANVAIWGEVTATIDETTVTVTNPTVSDNKKVTLTCEGVTLTSTPQTFFIMLPPVTLTDGFTIRVFNGNDLLKETSTTNVVTIERNWMKTMTQPIDVSQASVAPDKSFSIANGSYVWFAPGNLQYKDGETYPWRFALHQYDCIGTWDITDWVDHFGWGAWTGSTPNPLNDSFDNTTFIWDSDDFAQESLLADEAQRAYDWYTLSMEQWLYIFTSRTDAGNKWGCATVANKTGCIVLPDIWNGGELNHNHSTFSDNVISASDWLTWENDGAIFLPTMGVRQGSDFKYVDDDVNFWSSTTNNPYQNVSYGLIVEGNGYCSSFELGKYYGQGVRLVRNAN